MYELMQLSGQEYVDIYAASLKDKPAEPPQQPDRIPESAAG
jgi:1-acyl-sn-glycerol-3-phosphate acyltransferase